MNAGKAQINILQDILYLLYKPLFELIRSSWRHK